MSKILKTAAIIVGAVALVATGIGAAAGAGLFGAAAVHGAVAFGITASTLTTVGTIAGVAAAALSGVAALTAKKPTAQATGSPTDFSADPDAGIPLAIGRTGTAGDINARFGYDTADKGDNDRQSFVATLSLGPIEAVEGMTVDKVGVSYTAAGVAIGAFAGFMWSTFQLGAMPEPAALTFGAGAGTPPGWTAQHKMSGIAAATWTLRFDPDGKKYQNGVPAPMWTVRGAKCYDPTKDSTYPGGLGPHRMADPADTAAYDSASDTWEWTENPYLLALRWAHGLWQRDRSKADAPYQRVMGMGASWSGIDVAAFVEGRNVAEANGWKAGGMIYSGDDKWDTMKKILQAGMGEPLALGARISCLVNAPKVSLATITVDDVIGTASVAGTQPRRNRINTITPRYRLEANNWQLLPGAPIGVPEYVIADRGKRSKVQDYPFIQQTPQVATAVRYDIENAREFGPITLPLKLVWMGYKPGDCVKVVLPEVGLNGQPVLLLNRELDPSQGIVTMTARSETADKHPYALGQTTTPPPTPGLTGPPLIPIPKATSWAITGSAIQSASGTVPAIVVEGARDAATIDGILFDYRKFANGLSDNDGWIAAGVEPPTAVAKVITGVEAEVQYQVSVRYSRASRAGDRLIIGPVNTNNVSLSWPVVTGPNRPQDNATRGTPFGEKVGDKLAEELLDDLKTDRDSILSLGLTQQQMQETLDTAAYVDGQPVSTAFEMFHNEQEGINSALESTAELLGAKSPDGTAFELNMSTVHTAPDKTIGQHFEDIEAKNSENAASVQVLNEVVLGDDGSATARALIKVGVNNSLAGIVLIASDGSVQEISEIGLIAGVTKIAGQNGNLLAEFLEQDGLAYIPKLMVDTIKIGTGSTTGQPSVVTGNSKINLTGSPTTILSIPIITSGPATIYASTSIHLTFDGNDNWNQQVLINGQRVFGNNGGQIEHGPAMSGALYLPAAGTWLVEFQVWGASAVYVTDRSLFAVAFYDSNA